MIEKISKIFKNFFDQIYLRKVFFMTNVLCLFFLVLAPQLCLKKSAKCTYNANEIQVNIVASSSVASNVDVQGTINKEYIPSKNQISSVKIPLAYKRNFYSFDVYPEFSSKKADIIFSIQKKNPKESLNVLFEDFRVNGKVKKIFQKSDVIYSIEQVHPEKLTVSFNLKKTISFSDLKWSHLLKLYLGIFLISVLFYKNKRFTLKFIDYFRKDWFAFLWNKYKSIDIIYRKTFWFLFILLNIVFSVHTINFMWGKHDWDYLLYPSSYAESFWLGRYLNFFIRHFLLENITYLPILQNLLCFVCLSLSAIYLCSFFNLKKSLLSYVLCGLFLTVQPYTLEWFWFNKDLPELFIAICFVINGYLGIEHKNRIFNVLGIFCFIISLSIYPCSINTIAVVFAWNAMLKVRNCENKSDLKSIISRLFLLGMQIGCALVVYKCITKFILPIADNSYNTQSLTIKDIPQRMLMIFKQSFINIYHYPVVFISPKITKILFVFNLIFVVQILKNKNIKNKGGVLFFYICAVCSTQMAMVVSNEYYSTAIRIDFFGLLIHQALVCIYLLNNLPNLKNILNLGMLFIVFISVQNTLYAQKIWI